MLNIIVHAIMLQTLPIGSDLSDGMSLVYESAGVEQAPWIYDAVRVVDRDGFDRCVTFTRRGQVERESCTRADTLFDLGNAGVYVATRPLGPNMTLEVQTSTGNSLYYTTGEASTQSVSGDADVRVIPTVILTRDSTGATIRRLREEYAPSLLTAVRGAFEAPDDAGGWSIVREFHLVRVSRADTTQASANTGLEQRPWSILGPGAGHWAGEESMQLTQASDGVEAMGHISAHTILGGRGLASDYVQEIDGQIQTTSHTVLWWDASRNLFNMHFVTAEGGEATVLEGHQHEDLVILEGSGPFGPMRQIFRYGTDVMEVSSAIPSHVTGEWTTVFQGRYHRVGDG